jgi:RHS repeat-associated protein
LTSLAHKKSDNSVIQCFAYVLDKVGNRTKLTLDGGDYLEYVYDSMYQLTREHRKTSGGSTQYYNEFYYNYISNRTKLIHNDGTSSTTTTYSYNAGDQLTRDITGASTTDYSYDANGALTRKSSDGSNFDYLYDARSLITKYDAPGTDSDVEYQYDCFSRRVAKSEGGNVTTFLFDGRNVLADYDETSTSLASYIPVGIDAFVSLTNATSVYYYHTDPLGSVYNLTNASEAIENTYAYQAFGELYGTPTEGAYNRYRFTGAAFDSGRWGSRDPLVDADGPHLYRYVSNQPTRLIDLMGLVGIDTRNVCCTFSDVQGIWPFNRGDTTWNQTISCRWGKSASRELP